MPLFCNAGHRPVSWTQPIQDQAVTTEPTLPASRAEMLEMLRWQMEMGIDLALNEAAANRFEEAPALSRDIPSAPGQAAQRQLPQRAAPPRTAASSSAPVEALPGDKAIASARELAAGAATLDALREAMARFEGCNLRLTARSLVFADGNREAKIMLVGEAPGREEDEQGLPFVGRSGQLLDKMLAAIGLNRTKVYITNVIPWRPPGNRTPTPQETEICRPFVERHIELMQPEVLVLLGGPSAKTILNTQAGITQIRGRWTKVNLGGREIDALPTLHPAYLLRQPAQKKLAWQDLLKLKQYLIEAGQAAGLSPR
jgi:DNA polymerase